MQDHRFLVGQHCKRLPSDSMNSEPCPFFALHDLIGYGLDPAFGRALRVQDLTDEQLHAQLEPITLAGSKNRLSQWSRLI